ncbi:hypothetical protein DPMN_049975 [Dreissena polymorpha]|uniref:Uncharacterized protein n=1 Tax=Dreissena polymorpha TaxID=45954 RepID=A0A9D4HLT7_DREPO|nr:hypothetical protein DPMN_049975 [Dreissena polymorpha]
MHRRQTSDSEYHRHSRTDGSRRHKSKPSPMGRLRHHSICDHNGLEHPNCKNIGGTRAHYEYQPVNSCSISGQQVGHD